jgi:lactoylglutathione lyase
VHDHADETLVGLQRYFDLAEFVVRIGVVEREPDEALDDGAQSALFLRLESRGCPEGRKERKDVRRRALVAQDADRHARHRRAILERPCSRGRGATIADVARFLHTMVRITDPAKSRAFYEALGFTFAGDFDIVRDGQVEATNYFFSLGDQESVLELTYNHDGRSYDLGSGYGHIAVGVDDLDGTLERLAQQGIDPERPPYSVREGGSRLCFVQDPDGYRIELIGRS